LFLRLFAVAVLAMATAVGGLTGLTGSAQADVLPKVTLCHVVEEEEEFTQVVIEVSENSLDSHLAHGDFVIDELNPDCPPATG
jgi:hypothetical protein